MEPAPNMSGDIALIIALFAIAWLGACALISLTGGWHRLAAKFRATSASRGDVPAKKFSKPSMPWHDLRFQFGTSSLRS